MHTQARDTRNISPANRFVGRWVMPILAVFVLSAPPALHAETLPQNDGLKHTGVATCASVVCHGRVLEDTESDVLRNEYRTWARHDRHAKAYATLLSDDSKAIARKLGLKNAHEAKICLDCHADNVPQDRRGRRFHLEDGVGCEACHGGSERWLVSHATRDATHADNLAAGLYPTDDIQARAKLCLSCHYGTADKFATHRIMGAGHPRIAFELDTFTIRQPEHYELDERQSSQAGVSRWAMGMLVNARQSMALLDSPLFLEAPVYPEIALFDCHSCHQSLNDLTWKARPSTAAIGPGIVRLNDSSLLIAIAIVQRLDPNRGTELADLLTQLHKASAKSRRQVVTVSRRIDAVLQSAWNMVSQHQFDQNDAQALLSNVLALGAKGEFRDYAAAEQAVMGIDVLTYAGWPQNTNVRRRVDSLYKIVANDDRYPPDQLQVALKDLSSAIK